MVFGRRRDYHKKNIKNTEKYSDIVSNIACEYIRNKRNKNYVNVNNIINMENQFEYIINMDKKLKFFYKKNKNIDLYHYLTGSLNYFDNKIRKSKDINKYLNHYHKVNILINGKQYNNLIEN